MKINAIQVRVNERPEVIQLENSLEELQKKVGGYIEFISLYDDDDVDIIINEEGKLNGLPLNKFITHKGQIIDALMGDILIVGVENETGKTVDIPAHKISKYLKLFSRLDLEI